jgi:ABC-type uncharacterized transport system permease subunit
MSDVLVPFLEATIRTATPLALAALGETVTERSGIINVGLEGSIIAGALASLIMASFGGVSIGFVGAAVAGALMALLFACFVIYVRGDQIITGTAVTIFALGLTGVVYRLLYGETGAALTTPTLAPLRVPLLADLPYVGTALFAQPPVTYLVYLLTPALWWWMYKTHGGLTLRATGENPDAAISAGIQARRVQLRAVVFGGMLGGVSGATLVLAQAGTFAEGMSAGRGFIAIAIVVLGRWNPAGVAMAAIVFGAASALQFLLQAMGWNVPYQLFLALPYVLTLVALVVIRGRGKSPEALGRTSTA